ncbi:ImpB/MucB/SamB family protein, partial [Bacteroides fragilis]
MEFVLLYNLEDSLRTCLVSFKNYLQEGQYN